MTEVHYDNGAMPSAFSKFLEPITKRFSNAVSNEVGIDLGTANTLVYVRGRGIVINEPSVVAVNQKTGQIVAIGRDAREMLGRTPGHISAVRPLTGGVISDFEVTEEMIAHLLHKAEGDTKRVFGPRVVVGVPSGITNVETRAVRDAIKNAGAREVYLVEEPVLAAIGMRLPIHAPIGTMVIDIGGGTTDVAVISLFGIVKSKNIRIAGDTLNSDIISYIRNEFKILIGEKTAEGLKIATCSVLPPEDPLEAPVRGRDLVTGLPREVVITDSDVREAISPSIDHLIDAIKEVVESTPPEMLSDVMQRGIYVTGGGALIRGMDILLEDSLKMPIRIADDPLTTVVRGAGMVLENLEYFKEVLIDHDDDSLTASPK